MLCSAPKTVASQRRVVKTAPELETNRDESAYTCPTWKRCFDVAAAGILGIACLPVLLLTALLIKCTSKGPIFYRQKRVGLGGIPFEILKFRSMHVRDSATEEHRDYVSGLRDGVLKKPSTANRLIPFGQTLRRWSIDELPQLWNIIRGDMSLVGPRPDVLQLSDYEDSWERQRFSVLPGLTGLWQVSGKNRLTFQEMISLDNQYVEKLSWRLDLYILLKTVPAVLSQSSDS